MSFTEQQKNWQTLAEKDPMWAILSEPEKRGGKWDEQEFYATGREEAESVWTTLSGLGLAMPRGKMLEVGCGVGRVTGWFADYFASVTGYDISPEMLKRAEATGTGRVRYTLNTTDDLSPFDDGSFDFVYCSKVLQHVDPDRVGEYMKEMVRVTKPGGVIFCQMLSHPTGWEGSTESGPDPEWNARYTVVAVPIDAMMKAWVELGVIIHQARLVAKGKGQSLFSYDYVLEKR